MREPRVNHKLVARMKEKERNKQTNHRRKSAYEPTHKYPMTRFVPIKHIIKSRDLYHALLLMVLSQIPLIIVSVGNVNSDYRNAASWVAVVFDILLVLYLIRYINIRQYNDLNRKAMTVKTIWSSVVLIVLGVYTINMLYGLSGAPIIEQSNQAALEKMTESIPLVMILNIAIVAPIVEEVIYRECLPFAVGPSILSFIISTTIFVAMHSPDSLVGWLSYGYIAMMLLYARLKDNNLWSSILVHMIWNGLSVVIMLS